ncbi:hypothetical protein G195_001104 [Phytophthora kernoviae 00238/432]|uniref:Na+/H+ antiporter NhaC-like C-terminal domain-containing protein n=1 Tax=Phytophthora kernoviae 00238/432 TaxID=1284355 RepID=A0A8J4WPL6_9STRA|nr:hypothetical protein G195_001104 [Phytophthora kernoviae 00238/432]
MIGVTSNGQVSILMPGEMLREAYIRRGLHPKNLGRTIEDSATIIEPILPWTAAGAYMAGFGITKLTPEQQQEMLKEYDDLGMNAAGEFPDSVSEQTKQSLTNVKAILEAAEYAMEHVVKTTVFLKDMNDFQTVNEVYATFFAEPYPARSAVEVAKLPKGGLVEIEVIAVK